MKHSIVAIAFAAMLPMSLAAAECPYDITWLQGKEFSTSQQIPNRTAKAFQSVYGTFPDGTQIKVLDGKTATISGPADSHLNKKPTITQLTKTSEDPNNPGNYISVLLPGFRVKFSNSDWYSVEAPGVYTLTMPAGSFTINGEENVEFDVEFSVEDTRVFTPIDFEGYTTNPSDGYSADIFKDFSLTIVNVDANNKRLYNTEGVKFGAKLKVTNTETNEVRELDINTASAMTGKLGWTAKCEPAITAAGTYTVEWPEGSILLSGNDDPTKLYTNRTISYNITCTGSGSEDPEPVSGEIVWAEGNQWASKSTIMNNTVNRLGTLWGIYNNNTVEVPHSNSAEAKKATVTGPATGFTEGKEVTIDQVRIPADNDKGYVLENAFKILISGAPLYVETPGEYTVAIPAGAFKIDGADNAAIEYKVKVEDTRDYKPINLPIDRVTPTPDGETTTTQGTLAKITINIANTAVDGKRPYRSLGVSQTLKPSITLPDGTSNSFDLISLGSFTDNIRYMVGHDGDYGYTAPGKYTLTIPQGTILLEAEEGVGVYYTNTEIKYFWTLAGSTDVDYKLTVVPATKNVQSLAGIEVSSLDNFFLNVKEPSLITVTTPSGETKELKSLVSPNELYINCFRENEIFTEAGEYKFNIGVGAISFKDASGNEAVSTKPYSMTYNVSGGTIGELEYAISNDKGETVTDGFNTYLIDSFYVKFDKNVTATQNAYCTVVYPDNSKQFVKATWSSSNNRFMIYMSYPKQSGAYKITFPAGAACADGVFNSQIEFTVNLLEKGEEELALTTTPASNTTVTELFNISVIGSAEEYTQLSTYRGGITMTYFQNDDEPDARQMQYLKETKDPLRFTIELNEAVTATGDYTWTIPAESIIAVKKDGTQVIGKEVKFYWSIRNKSEVDTICEGDANVTVFNMNGVCLLRNAAREELAKLPKGMYVINGRTFILK